MMTRCHFSDQVKSGQQYSAKSIIYPSGQGTVKKLALAARLMIEYTECLTEEKLNYLID